MLALSQFTDQVHSIATKFLRERIVIARSVEHQLATALALLDEVSEVAGLTRVPAAQISWKRLERLCAIYPPLEATIVVSIDESDLSATSVSAETITAV